MSDNSQFSQYLMIFKDKKSISREIEIEALYQLFKERIFEEMSEDVLDGGFLIPKTIEGNDFVKGVLNGRR